jgi:membrane protease YdiL (CAAX protease family)
MSADSINQPDSLPPGPLPPELPPPRSGQFPLHSIFVGPHGVRAGWRAALYVALFFIFMSIAATVIRIFLPLLLVPNGPITPGILGLQEGLAVFCALLAAYVLARLEGRRFGEYGMPWARAFQKKFWLGAIWGILAISAMMLFIDLSGGYSLGAVDLPRAALVHYALEWAGVFLLVGMYEEFFFRGYLLFTLNSGMSFWPAAILLSLIFGAVHLRNPGEGSIGALSVFVTGMFLCFTLRRTGTLWFAIGFHAAWDYGETYIYSVPDSGIVMPGHLLASSFHGPAWLTGGTVGPEGSAFDFVVMALLFVIFDRIYRTRKAYPTEIGPDAQAPAPLPAPGER